MFSNSKSTRKEAIYIIVLSFIGIALAAWLTYIHVRVHVDPEYVSFCALSENVNCETVAVSPYSVFLGLPVSVWGLISYLALLMLAISELEQKKGSVAAGRLMGLGLAIGLVSVLLALLSTFVIRAVCLFCMATYLTNLLVAVIGVKMARKQGGFGSCFKREARALRANRLHLVYGVLILAVIFLAGPLHGFPQYWEMASWRDGPLLPHGIDEGGRPWLGAQAPKLVVQEYFNYECPHCRAAHRKLRRILSKHSSEMRIVRYDYGRTACAPNDAEQRLTKCAMVRAAYCSSLENRYWDWNDAVLAHPKPLFGKTRMTYEIDMAQTLGFDTVRFKKCLFDKKTIDFAQRIYKETRKNRVRMTPTYMVDTEKVTLKQLSRIIPE